MAFWWWIAQHAATTALGIVIVLAICRLAPHRPGLWHVLWVALLIKFLVPPIVAWPWHAPRMEMAGFFVAHDGEFADGRAERPPHFGGAATDTRLVTPDASSPEGASTVAPPESSHGDTHSTRAEVQEADAPEIAAARPRRAEQPPELEVDHKAAPQALAPEVDAPIQIWRFDGLAERGAQAFVFIWIVGAIIALARQGRRIGRLAAVVNHATAGSPRLQAEVARAAKLLAVRPVAVVVSDLVPSPFVWCWGSVRLVWPSSSVDEASLERLRGVLTHELAHVRRRDHWIAWLEIVAGIVWWFHPLCWFVRRRLNESAELACDALALAAAPEERGAMAECLLSLSSCGEPSDVAPALGAGSRDAKVLQRRLTMMFSNRVTSRLSWRGWCVAAMLALLLLPNWSPGQAPPAAPPAAPAPESPVAGEQPDPADELTKLKKRVQDFERENAVLKENLKALNAEFESERAKRERIALELQGKIVDSRRAVPSEAATNPDRLAATDAGGILGGEQIDLLALGLALADARGDVALAGEKYESSRQMNAAGEGAVTRSDVRTAQIRLESARNKLKLLQTIAGVAQESTAAELKAQVQALERMKQLAEKKVITAQVLLTAEARLRGLDRRFKLIEAILKD